MKDKMFFYQYHNYYDLIWHQIFGYFKDSTNTFIQSKQKMCRMAKFSDDILNINYSNEKLL